MTTKPPPAATVYVAGYPDRWVSVWLVPSRSRGSPRRRGLPGTSLPVGLVVVALGRWPDVGNGMAWPSCRAGHRSPGTGATGLAGGCRSGTLARCRNLSRVAAGPVPGLATGRLERELPV